MNTIYQETVRWRGTPVLMDAVQVKDKTFILSGGLIKTAALKDEWYEDMDNPAEVIRQLKASPGKIDLLRFWQRVPDTEPKYDFYKEWTDIAAIPIKSYDEWWKEQISSKTRNMVRKSQKLGVIIREADLTDELIRGIVDIFNQSPIRRGKRFWHYRKPFDAVRKDMSLDAGRSIFIAAYYAEELIGFVKLLLTDRYAMITLILDKTIHRDKSPMNGMIAKAVEICAERKIKFLTYTVWRRGDHGEFQKRNGFERITVPEYFVPLTLLGSIVLSLGLHTGVRALIPETLMSQLLALRARWYAFKYRQIAA